MEQWDYNYDPRDFFWDDPDDHDDREDDWDDEPDWEDY